MQKTITRTLSLVLAVVLLLSFAACRQKPDDTVTTTNTQVTEPVTEPTTQEPTMPALTEDEVFDIVASALGEGVQWTGDYAVLTAQQKETVKAAFAARGYTVTVTAQGIDFSGAEEITTEPGSMPAETTNANGVTTTRPPVTTKPPAVTVAAGGPVKEIKIYEIRDGEPEEIKLSRGMTILPNASKQLEARALPENAKNRAVKWEVLEDNYVEVDANGKITAKGKTGTTAIICTAMDGSGVQRTIPITVGRSSILSYMHDPEGKYFYTESDPWQRNFGFNRWYDWAANFAFMYYDTVRVKFDYKDLNWMIQLWKGQYGAAFLGSEIGVYTKPETRTSNHYDCASDENRLNMEMTLYRKGEKLFTRPYDAYWWSTGFVPGVLDKFSDRSELTMVARITFKDKEMTDAFVADFENSGFKRVNFVSKDTPDSFKVVGNEVFFAWKTIKHDISG